MGDDAVTARVLGFIQTSVRPRDELRRLQFRIVMLHMSQAHTGRKHDLLLSMGDADFLDVQSQCVGHDAECMRLDAGHDNGELFTTVACGELMITIQRGQASSDSSEDGIADLVAECVVELFESVKIQHQQADGPTVHNGLFASVRDV